MSYISRGILISVSIAIIFGILAIIYPSSVWVSAFFIIIGLISAILQITGVSFKDILVKEGEEVEIGIFIFEPTGLYSSSNPIISIIQPKQRKKPQTMQQLADMASFEIHNKHSLIPPDMGFSFALGIYNKSQVMLTHVRITLMLDMKMISEFDLPQSVRAEPHFTQVDTEFPWDFIFESESIEPGPILVTIFNIHFDSPKDLKKYVDEFPIWASIKIVSAQKLRSNVFWCFSL